MWTAPISHPRCDARRGRSSFDEKPADTSTATPNLISQCRDGAETDYVPVVLEDEGMSYGNDHHRSKADTFVTEIAYYLELMERDEYPHRPDSRKVTRELYDAVSQLRSSCYTMVRSTSTPSQSFDHALRFIAIQLLASCYTLLPATSSRSVPLHEQRRRPRVVTALRLHTYYRYAPAAGYHARDPSEATPWPGLYRRPSSEEEYVDTLLRHSQHARDKKSCRDHTSDGFEQIDKIDGWSDGTGEKCSTPKSPHLPSAEAGSSVGTLRSWKSLHQPLAPRNSEMAAGFFKRQSGKSQEKKSLFFCRPQFGGRNKRADNQDKTEALPIRPRHFTLRKWHSDPIWRIPSKLHPWRVNSSPPTPELEDVQLQRSIYTRRSSSTPTLGSLMPYRFEIPRILRISPSTPAASLRSEIRIKRSDLLHAERYLSKRPPKTSNSTPLYPFEEGPLSAFSGTTAGRPSSLSLDMSPFGGEHSSQGDYFSPLISVEGAERGFHELEEHDTFDWAVTDTDSSSDESVMGDRIRRASICSISESVEIERRLGGKSGVNSWCNGWK